MRPALLVAWHRRGVVRLADLAEDVECGSRVADGSGPQLRRELQRSLSGRPPPLGPTLLGRLAAVARRGFLAELAPRDARLSRFRVELAEKHVGERDADLGYHVGLRWYHAVILDGTTRARRRL